jgi:hypothetical protein
VGAVSGAVAQDRASERSGREGVELTAGPSASVAPGKEGRGRGGCGRDGPAQEGGGRKGTCAAQLSGKSSRPNGPLGQEGGRGKEKGARAGRLTGPAGRR